MEEKKERKILQVALDVLELERAIEIGRECLEGGADWLEAGTPLIKSEGMNAIRALKDAFPEVNIVADMKTMDTGAIEMEMAAKSGASVVSILAVADNAVIEEAVKSARKYGVAVMVDIMNTEDPVRRAKELEEMGVDYVCVHVGIDQQMRGMDVLSLLENVSAAISTPLAVAGGIDAEMASEAVNLGADIIIVGGNITRSAKVRDSTIKIRERMDLGTVEKEETKDAKKRTLDARIFELFMQVSTPNISDALHRKGVMQGIKPVFDDNIKLVG
ncbi:MAG: orotidine 5'-phosphate decarboxylase, partial [Methanophagales archaeon]|nr:orotidine 5'-phosphate decarboxylase [Methanophagales archaeon]